MVSLIKIQKWSKKFSIKPQREGKQIANKFIYFAMNQTLYIFQSSK